VAGQRALVGVYVAGHFRDRITTRGRGGDTSILSAKEWKRADSLVAAIPQVTVEQLRAADQLVDSTWNGVPPGSFSRERDLPRIAVIMLMIFFSALSVATALFARRGLVMRALGLELVTRKGEPAGRVRLVWRQLLVWAPLIALSFVPMVVALQSRSIGKAVAFGAVAIGLVAVSIFTAWRTPARGLTERLSGTTMVPE
jgi:hypothetical protein